MQRIILHFEDAQGRVRAGLLRGKTDSEKIAKIMLYLSDTEAYAKVKGTDTTVEKTSDVEYSVPTPVTVDDSKKAELHSLRQNQIVLFVLLLISIIVTIFK